MKGDGWIWAAIGGVLVAVLVTVIYLATLDARAKIKCKQRGGRVVQGECHMNLQCHRIGKTTTCHTVKTCEWRCEMP